jgi:hypothetical protein
MPACKKPSKVSRRLAGAGSMTELLPACPNRSTGRRSLTLKVSRGESIFFHFSPLESKTGAERETGQARALGARQRSGRSEAERLDAASALRILAQERWAYVLYGTVFVRTCTLPGVECQKLLPARSAERSKRMQILPNGPPGEPYAMNSPRAVIPDACNCRSAEAERASSWQRREGPQTSSIRVSRHRQRHQ